MSSNKLTRKTRSSHKHLASDFEWQGLQGLDLPATGLSPQPEDDLLPERCDPSTSFASKRATAKPLQFDLQLFAFPLHGDGLTPDSRPLSTSSKPTKTKHKKLDPLALSPVNAALDDNNGDLQCLELLKQTLELEIRKLELQLELAKISSPATQIVKQANIAGETSKSMGDLKAPQKIRFPQLWPHIFAPGEPQLFSELSLPAFCAGYSAILQQQKDKSPDFPYDAQLNHFQDLMVLACSYKWSAVRLFHYKALRSIELGLVKPRFSPLPPC